MELLLLMPSQAQSSRPAATGAKGVSDRSGELLLLEPKVVFSDRCGDVELSPVGQVGSLRQRRKWSCGTDDKGCLKVGFHTDGGRARK